MVVAAFGLTGVVVGLASTFLSPAALQWLFPLTLAVLVMLATWVCLRLEGRCFADLGLQFTRRRLLEVGAGFAIGAVLFAGIALAQAAMVGISWQLSHADVAGAVLAGLATMLTSVLVEELLFRGYVFGQLTALGSPALALIVTSAAFGAYHLIGKPYWAIGAFFVIAMPALGGLIFGYSLLRTGGLALPLGLHWGGNWALMSLFGWQDRRGFGPRRRLPDGVDRRRHPDPDGPAHCAGPRTASALPRHLAGYRAGGLAVPVRMAARNTLKGC
jgi:membrane protease YdiL (CAAX protease family)